MIPFIITYTFRYFSWRTESAHLLFLVVLELVMMSMSVFECVDAQAGTAANPSFGYTLRVNLKSTMCVMLVAFFAAFIFMGIFSLYLRHCSYGHGPHRSPLVAATDLCRRGVNRQAIDKCPILLYSAVKDLKIGRAALECAVCLSEFQDYDHIRLLPKCHHVFHPECIDEWLLPQMSCPVCRSRLTSDAADTDIALATTSFAPNTETEQHEQQQQQNQVVEVVVRDEVAGEHSGERDIAVREPRMLDKLPRSHSTGHSLVELLPEGISNNNAVDRYTLRLPEHVRKQILASRGRVRRFAASDVVFPGAWSSKRVCYRGDNNNNKNNDNNVVDGDAFVSCGWDSVNDGNSASESEGGGVGGGGGEVYGRRCRTPLRMSFCRVEGAQKPAHVSPV